MARVSLLSPDALRRALFQQGRVSLFHALAFVAVTLAFLASHVEPTRSLSCTKVCALSSVFRSMVAWWPIAASWLVVKNPGETFISFLWWQVLFVLVNVAAAIGYAMTEGMPLVGVALWSILHFAILMAMAPLAVEWEQS